MTLNGNSADELAAQLMLNPQAISEAVRRGLLSFKTHRGVACWRLATHATAVYGDWTASRFNSTGTA
jgi:hypothetical protein